MKLLIINSVVRNSLLKLKHSSIINLIGLSIGFTVLLAIVFFIREEINFNQFHDKIDNIYCVFTKDHNTTDALGYNESVPALPEALRKEYPEVQDAALVYNGSQTLLISYDDKKFYEQVQLADPNLFHIFSFPITRGQIPINTEQTKIIALSQRMASKYFGNENPIGKELKINNKDIFTVIAIFENIPTNSSLQFDIWAPVQLLNDIKRKDYLKTWSNLSFQSYVLMKDNRTITTVNRKLIGRIQQSNTGSTAKAQLYPFKDLYLIAWGHKKGIQVMVLIAFIILTLVCINFINLQTSEAFKRIREFGIKKINGARISVVYKELIGEAIIYVSLAIIVAVIITSISSAYLVNLLGKSESTNSIISIFSVLILTIVAFLIAFLSGLIPGLAIKSISPYNSLKDKISERIGIKKIRYIFTALQFCMAIILIICLIVTNKQVSYLRNKDLGFSKTQLLYLNLNGDLKEKFDVLKKELDKNPSILSTSVTSRSPIGIYWNGTGWNWEGKLTDFDPQITFIETDKDFQKTFDIKMIEGDYFKSDLKGVIVNKTFAQMISPDGNVLHKILSSEGINVKIPIIGVINDFHFKPLSQKIEPLMLIPQLGFDNMKYLFVKISSNNIRGTLQFMKETVLKINPDFPYETRFFDDDFSRLYKSEERLRDQMMFFSVMAILISAIGLWGILLFMVKQRTKEIAILRVNGARVSEILSMLNKDFIKWVAIAFLIACPIAWYAMYQWLQNFAYKTELSWWVFALAGIVAVAVAVLTVSWQSWRAATRNPVESLRYE